MDEKEVVFEEEEEKTNRLSEYKSRSVICDQETRRLQFLLDQKRRRDKTFNDLRNADLLVDWDDEFDFHEDEKKEVMEWTSLKPKRVRLKDMFMLSEWMGDLPEDFDSKWMFVICPVGKRCLVHCAKGHTSVYGKKGQRLARFQSALPNGGQREVTDTKYSNAEVTILDCIWSSQTKCYFILDLLSWRGQSYMDTDLNFRVFWIKSKVEETPALSEICERNPYPFIPLEYHPCDFSTISSIISQHPYFPLDEPKVDGVLFYHSEGYYTPGLTPLVLWLKPFMLPEVLNLTIPDVYEQMKPSFYVNREQFILEYEKRKSKSHKRTQRRSQKMQVDAKETNEEVTMCEE